jgi:hypothetical protein
VVELPIHDVNMGIEDEGVLMERSGSIGDLALA